MTLRYETSITTFIQLVITSLFIIVGGVIETGKECQNGASSCVVSSFLWMVILLFVGGFFVCLTALGYFAQTKRSSRLAKLLIVAELGVALACLMLIRTPSSVLGGIGSFLIFLLSLWTVVLAYRLTKAKGARIVATTRTQKARPRRPKKSL
jgi:FtsH-binding integral membrane protein